MFTHGKSRVPVREAVLHCAGINTGQFAHMRPFQVFATINKWHKERGFTNGFGYHGLIMPDGTFYSGRPYSMIGAHVQGHNTGTLGFLLIESEQIKVPPGITNHKLWLDSREFSDWFRPAQRAALRKVLAVIPGLQKVSGHNDYAPKLCPGFRVKSSDWL